MNQYNLITKIKSLEANKNSSADSAISKALLKNISNIQNLTIGELALLASCSKPSIVKYCKKLNLSGYKELTRIIIFETSMNSAFNENFDNTNDNYLNVIKNNIDFLSENYSKGFDKIKEVFDANVKVYLFGKGPNINSCNILYNYLVKLNYNVIFSSDLDVQTHMMNNLDQNSLCFFFTYSGLTTQLIDIYNEAVKRKSKIVYCGSNTMSPMYSDKNINFIVKNNEEVIPGQKSSIISFNIIIMQIINILYKSNNKQD